MALAFVLESKGKIISDFFDYLRRQPMYHEINEIIEILKNIIVGNVATNKAVIVWNVYERKLKGIARIKNSLDGFNATLKVSLKTKDLFFKKIVTEPVNHQFLTENILLIYSIFKTSQIKFKKQIIFCRLYSIIHL